MRLIQYCVEDRREITGRGINDLQNLGGRCLLLQGLARFGQEPRILDCNDRLVGKGAHQLDLTLGERLHPLASERQHPDRFALSQERHAQRAAPFPNCNGVSRIIRIGGHVINVDRPAFKGSSPGSRDLQHRGNLPHTVAVLGATTQRYSLASLRYDLSKLRIKGLVEKLPQDCAHLARSTHRAGSRRRDSSSPWS